MNSGKAPSCGEIGVKQETVLGESSRRRRVRLGFGCRIDLHSHRRGAELYLVSRKKRDTHGISRHHVEDRAAPDDTRPVVTPVVEQSVFAAGGVVLDRRVGAPDGRTVLVAVFHEHDVIVAWPARVIRRDGRASDAYVQFLECVGRLRGLSPDDVHTEYRRHRGGARRSGACYDARPELHRKSLLRRPARFRPLHVVNIHVEAGGYGTSDFAEPITNGIRDVFERRLQCGPLVFVPGDDGHQQVIVRQHTPAGSGRLRAADGGIDDRFPNLERPGIGFERRIRTTS